jgi:hypothetical protein
MLINLTNADIQEIREMCKKIDDLYNFVFCKYSLMMPNEETDREIATKCFNDTIQLYQSSGYLKNKIDELLNTEKSTQLAICVQTVERLEKQLEIAISGLKNIKNYIWDVSRNFNLNHLDKIVSQILEQLED